MLQYLTSRAKLEDLEGQDKGVGLLETFCASCLCACPYNLYNLSAKADHAMLFAPRFSCFQTRACLLEKNAKKCKGTLLSQQIMCGCAGRFCATLSQMATHRIRLHLESLLSYLHRAFPPFRRTVTLHYS